MEVHPLIFCVHLIVNAYILYCMTWTRQTKQKYAHLNFQFKITMGLIAGFSSRKRKAEAPLYMGLVTAANKNNHENVHTGLMKGTKCKWALYAANEETVCGCYLCHVHLCKDGCYISAVISNIKLLIIFFNLPLISSQNFSWAQTDLT